MDGLVQRCHGWQKAVIRFYRRSELDKREGIWLYFFKPLKREKMLNCHTESRGGCNPGW